MSIQNLQQKNGKLLTVKQRVTIHTKTQSNFQQVHQNQVFVIILMHMFQLQEILVLQGANNYTKVAFKNYAPFRKCRTEINETFIDEAKHVKIAMSMYNLTEYNDNISDTLGSLWHFKRDEIEGDVD